MPTGPMPWRRRRIRSGGLPLAPTDMRDRPRQVRRSQLRSACMTSSATCGSGPTTVAMNATRGHRWTEPFGRQGIARHVSHGVVRGAMDPRGCDLRAGAEIPIGEQQDNRRLPGCTEDLRREVRLSVANTTMRASGSSRLATATTMIAPDDRDDTRGWRRPRHRQASLPHDLLPTIRQCNVQLTFESPADCPSAAADAFRFHLGTPPVLAPLTRPRNRDWPPRLPPMPLHKSPPLLLALAELRPATRRPEPFAVQGLRPHPALHEGRLEFKPLAVPFYSGIAGSALTRCRDFAGAPEGRPCTPDPLPYPLEYRKHGRIPERGSLAREASITPLPFRLDWRRPSSQSYTPFRNTVKSSLDIPDDTP